MQKFILSIREHENDRTRDSVGKMETETVWEYFGRVMSLVDVFRRGLPKTISGGSTTRHHTD